MDLFRTLYDLLLSLDAVMFELKFLSSDIHDGLQSNISTVYGPVETSFSSGRLELVGLKSLKRVLHACRKKSHRHQKP